MASGPMSGEQRNSFFSRLRFKVTTCFFLFFSLHFSLTFWLAAEVTTLENGLTLLIEKNTINDSTALCLLASGGRLTEPPGKEGLGYLVLRLGLDPPDSGYLREFMKTGAETRVASRGDFLLISVECPSAQFETTIKLIHRTLSRPIFSGIRINSLKQIMKNSQKKETDDVDSRAEVSLLAAFFNSQGYGASSFGTEASVEAIKGEDVVTYYRRHFAGSNLILSVVSDLEPEKIKSVIKATFGGWTKGEKITPPLPEIQLPENREINLEKEAKTAYLAVAFPLPPLTQDNFVLAHILEQSLGGGPEAKVWSLRWREKLAYEVGSKAILIKSGGCLFIYLKTLATKLSLAKEKLQEIIEAIAQNGLTPEEVEIGREAYRFSVYKSQEMKRQRAEALALYSGFGWGIDFDKFILNKIDNLSWPEISDYISAVVDLKRAVFLTIGPKGAVN